MLPISMGNSDFKDIREEGHYYIDKSLMIRELLQDRAKVVLLPRPRRFGKTLNLNMCETFFSDREPNRQLFDGLLIAEDPEAMKHHGGYPTISLTFKDLHADTWENCQDKLGILVSKLFQKFESRIKPSSAQQRYVTELTHGEASINLLEQALALLTQLLYEESGKKVFVFIDEYDAPIQNGYLNDYYDKIVGFMRNFLGSVLKDNSYLRKGVLTGVLRIAQESLFSGLNNIQVYTVLNQNYATSFGFTEQEVARILSDCQLQDEWDNVKNWYNGYKIGAETIYNPWSILSVAANPHNKLNSYWINTAQDKLIENLITKDRCLSLADLTTLLEGKTLLKEIRPAITLTRIDAQSIWSLLLFSGYLTFTEQQSETLFYLKLPNREVRTYFEHIVRRWIGGSNPDLDPFKSSLVGGDLGTFRDFVKENVFRIVGQNDTGGRANPENFYHGLILGLVACLNDVYIISSNLESGLGRYDVQLCPREPGPPGYIFEFKSLSSGTDKALKKGAATALSQIQAKKYASGLQNRGVSPLWLVGVAFHGKQVEMVWAEDPILAPTSGLPEQLGSAKSLGIPADLVASALKDRTGETLSYQPLYYSRQDLSKSYAELASEFRHLGATEEANTMFTHAHAALQESETEELSIADYQRELWVSYTKMGDMQFDLGHFKEALTFFQKALTVAQRRAEDDSASIDFQRPLWVTYRNLGRVLIALKKVGEADQMYASALQIAENLAGSTTGTSYQRDLMVSFADLGDLNVSMGNQERASVLYYKSLDLAEQALLEAPESEEKKRDVFVSYNNLGRLFQRFDNKGRAEEMFQKALVLSEQLVSEAPDDLYYQQDLLLTYMALGRLALAFERAEEARARFYKSLEIAIQIIQEKPEDSTYQRDLLSLYLEIGDLEVRMALLEDAYNAYRNAFNIAERLADKTPKTIPSQQYLLVSCTKLGDLNMSIGKPEEAVVCFNQAIQIQEYLVSQQPENLEFQLFLLLDYAKLGSLNQNLGKNQDAKNMCALALKMAMKLVEHQPERMDFLRNLWIAYYKMGELLSALEEYNEADDMFQRGHKIVLQLAGETPGNPEYQRDLMISYANLATVNERSGDGDQASTMLLESLLISQQLADNYPETEGHQNDLFAAYHQMGDLKSRLGEKEEALTMYGHALTIAKKLLTKYPDRLNYQIGFTLALISLVQAGESQYLPQVHSNLTALKALENLAPKDKFFLETMDKMVKALVTEDKP